MILMKSVLRKGGEHKGLSWKEIIIEMQLGCPDIKIWEDL